MKLSSYRHWGNFIPFFALLVVVIVLVAAQLRLATLSHFDSDEIEHSHLTWLVSQGIRPYVDIHQIHTPTLWILMAPLLARLPASAWSLMGLRALCVAAFAGSCLAGVMMLRKVPVESRPLRLGIFTLLAVAMFGQSQFYRIRPDPFMALCIAWAIVAVQRLDSHPLRYSILSGVLLGLAASFSPKMVPLCFLLPIVCVVDAIYKKSWRPLLLVFPNCAGFVLGIMPMLGWLWWHDLFWPFYEWTVVNNTHILNLNLDFRLPVEVLKIELILLFGLLSLAGGVLLIRKAHEGPARTAAVALVTAAGLGWAVRWIEPNHALYNLQAFVVPGAVLASIFLVAFSSWRVPRSFVWVTVCGGGFLLLYRPLVAEGVDLFAGGNVVTADNLEILINATQRTGTTCVGFAPRHPVYCLDATELYLGWDSRFLQVPWMTDAGKELYRKMWVDALTQIEDSPPDVIVSTLPFRKACKFGAITQSQLERFELFTQQHYREIKVRGYVYLLRSDVLPLAKIPAPERSTP